MVSALLFGAVLSTAETAPEGEETVAAQTKPEEDGTPETAATPDNSKILKLPGYTINRETLEIRMDAETCLDHGILEYVICLPETFEHEAIFVTKAKPELLHAALLLIGLKPNPQPPGLEVLWWDRALKRQDSRVRIEVEWEVGGVLHRVNLASMLRNREYDDEAMLDMEPLDEEDVEEVQDAWVFTGSFMHTNKETGERFYAANAGGVLVGIWPNPTSVIQYGRQSGNPYRGEHMGMEVNEEMVPKRGTKVKLVFSKFPQRQKGEPPTEY